jgi:hypothetical protein
VKLCGEEILNMRGRNKWLLERRVILHVFASNFARIIFTNGTISINFWSNVSICGAKKCIYSRTEYLIYFGECARQKSRLNKAWTCFKTAEAFKWCILSLIWALVYVLALVLGLALEYAYAKINSKNIQ